MPSGGGYGQGMFRSTSVREGESTCAHSQSRAVEQRALAHKNVPPGKEAVPKNGENLVSLHQLSPSSVNGCHFVILLQIFRHRRPLHEKVKICTYAGNEKRARCIAASNFEAPPKAHQRTGGKGDPMNSVPSNNKQETRNNNHTNTAMKNNRAKITGKISPLAQAQGP